MDVSFQSFVYQVKKTCLNTVPVKSKLAVTQLDSILNPQKFLIWS